MAQGIDMGVGRETGLGNVPEIGARRDGNGSGKPQLNLIFDYPKALAGVTLPMLDGNKKYGRHNWRKGMPQDVILDSLLRHVQALQSGEILVPDSEHGATHWDAIVSNALMLSELRSAAPMIDAASLGEQGRVDGDGVWRMEGYDAEGFDINGFDMDGLHRTHDFGSESLCNCPSCR